MVKFLICGNESELVKKLCDAENDDLQFYKSNDNSFDIKNTVDNYKPDGFIYCVQDPSNEQLDEIKSAREFLGRANEHFIVVGSDADLDVVFSRFEKIQQTIPKEIGFDVIVERVKEIAAEIKKEKYESVNSELAEASDVDVTEFVGHNADGAQKSANNNVKIINKKKIMIVDDDPNILRTIRNFLQEKYIISVATSGRVALKFLEEKVVDLIFLDYMMPEMDGPTTLSYIRQSVLTHKIPVVFLTGVNDRDKIRQILGMKIQGYLLKPVESEKLMDCIHKILQDY